MWEHVSFSEPTADRPNCCRLSVLLQFTAAICSSSKASKSLLFAYLMSKHSPIENVHQRLCAADVSHWASGAVEETDRFEVSEWYELHDVPEDRFALWWAQDSVVPIQNLHVCEVGVAHTHDDDGEGLVGGSDNGLARVRHVSDHAIGEDEQDVVPLEYDKSWQCWLMIDVNPSLIRAHVCMCVRMCACVKVNSHRVWEV